MQLIKFNSEMQQSVIEFFAKCYTALNLTYDPNGRHADTADIDAYYLQNGCFWCVFDNDLLVGTVGVIVLSTAFFAVFSIDQWKWLACIWAIVPIYNVYNFMTCPIENLVEDGKSMGIRSLLKVPTFWIAIVLMVCAGASELSMAQWASAYTESAIGLSKTIGDLAGPCMFAVMMGISRVIYGKYGEKLNLLKFMICSGILCLTCYLLAALSSNPILGLVGCIVCGFSVGIMWPGTISISSRKLPSGGTAMFALLAMAGDLGGAFGPSLVGNITQNANDNLQAGMLAGCVFPVVLVISLIVMRMTSDSLKYIPKVKKTTRR